VHHSMALAAPCCKANAPGDTMSQRYHRGGTYQTANPRAETSPLRSMPLFRPAAQVFGSAWHDGTWNQPKACAPPQAAPAAAAPVDAHRELANAEAALRDAVRVYDAARAGIGEANRTSLPDTLPAFIRAQIVASGGSVPIPRLTPDRIRARKSAAFRLFNQRRRELHTARRRVDAARAVLGLPSLTEIEARSVIATEGRASKRRPVHPIASVVAQAA
jgi:hypothetical protein